ncbi:MAG TPA: YdcF family protein [Devosia sp.]|jgi:uncharacterized SAM-binding protein YcdF (DUF218 family)|uniref:YdcF family protein n=1 Tax=Devosia sp. TaxID=1871048 RepID=UPI002F9505D6
MFYFLSKVFWVLAQPLSIVALLTLLALFCFWLGRRRLAIAAQVLAVLVLCLSSFTTFGALLIRPLEQRFERPATMPESVDTIIVLGGSTLARVSTARGVAELNEAGDRLTEAVILAMRYPEATIVFTGGTGLLDGGEAEAVTAERLFLSMGIAPERLQLEAQARNTDENAELTADLLGDREGTALLVTSAFHMPRSVGLFRRVGIEVVPWPTDYRGSGAESFTFDFANPVHSLNITTVALKEWIGLLAYALTGRIDTVFPAQTSN